MDTERQQELQLTTRAVGSPQPRKIIMSVITGGGTFLAIMLALVVAAIWLGRIRFSGSGPVDLSEWMNLQIIGGSCASILSGWISRRVAGHFRGPLILAGAVLLVALLEAAEILYAVETGLVQTPLWPVVVGPVVAVAGILVGGFRRSTERADGRP